MIIIIYVAEHNYSIYLHLYPKDDI